MKKREIAGTAADAALPKTPVEVGGKKYNLCLDLGALSEAETAINSEAGYIRVNLLFALPVLTLGNIRVVFAAALRVHHPEISFDEGQRLLGVDDLLTVATAMREAWNAAQPEAEKAAHPPQPGE